MQLTPKVIEFFASHGLDYGLDSSMTTVKPVLNWGGFVNSSFFISDGRTHFHLKITREDSAGLKLYFKASDILQKRYRSPKAHSWIKIPGTEFNGILFDYIQGQPVDIFSDCHVREIGRLLGDMQNDLELKCLLGNESLICSQTYLDVYDGRFSEDLRFIEGNLPPFVSQATFDFMRMEASKLKEIVQQSADFQAPTNTPIHSDIWANNLMITESGDWFLIDWDGLKIGDPSLDYAMLLGPSKNSWDRKLDPFNFGIDLPSASTNRVKFYQRAMLLDWIIDPLADWIEATHYPEWKEAVRIENEMNHKAALRCYNTFYL